MTAKQRIQDLIWRLLIVGCLAWPLNITVFGQTSPKGTFKIESETKPAPSPIEGTDVADFVVSTKDPKVREPLDDHPETTHVSYYISPDENWIFGNAHYGSRMAGGSLFKRRDGLKFKPVKDQGFEELTWHFFCQNEKLNEKDRQTGIIDFVAWSPDSARLLIDLRGGEFGGERERSVYKWYAYFNTKTETFELTPYLKRLNKGAWERYANFSDDNSAFGFVEEVIAEPRSELPPESESKKRYQKADQRLNELYQKVNTQGSEEAKANLGRDRKEWVQNREAGAKFYAESGPKTTAGQRYWFLMAERTEAQASAIEDFLKSLQSTDSQ